jgi:hypothetical protein
MYVYDQEYHTYYWLARGRGMPRPYKGAVGKGAV